jgi:hypothetical protein
MPEENAVVTPAFVDCTLEEIAMEANHEFKEHGGEEFRAIPCLNDDEWCQTVGNWINEWATVEKQQINCFFGRRDPRLLIKQAVPASILFLSVNILIDTIL